MRKLSKSAPANAKNHKSWLIIHLKLRQALALDLDVKEWMRSRAGK